MGSSHDVTRVLMWVNLAGELRPRRLGEIQQKRLASRENLKAVSNVLQHVALDLDSIFSSDVLQPIRPSCEERLIHRVGDHRLAYVRNKETGDCRWDHPRKDPDLLRLVLSPDEGGPLFCGYQFLSSKGGAVILNRDESCPACNLDLLEYVLPSNSRRHKLHNHHQRLLHSSSLMHRSSHAGTACPGKIRTKA